MDPRLRADKVRGFSDDLFERELHSRRPREQASIPPPEPPSAPEPVRAAYDVVPPPLTIEDVLPGLPDAPTEDRLAPQPAVVPEPVILESSRAWSASPAPEVRARIRKEMATLRGARVGGFFGLVLLLDFVLTHL